MTWVFWACVGFVFYTYLGYPALAWLCARFRPAFCNTAPGSFKDSESLPTVSIIIAAYNEAARMPAKLWNLDGLDYPLEKLDIIVVSDGCSDTTDEAVRDAEGVTLITYPTRRGKPFALNRGVAVSQSEVVVFTDVRQQLVPTALRDLMQTLRLPGIGVVSGELVHASPGSRQAQRIGLYWRYEKFIRKAESRWWSTVGTTGALYAIRRADFVPLPEDTILDDFEVPMMIVRQGERAVIDERAVMYDELQVEAAGERRRKVRTLTGNFQSCARNPWLFSPFANPVWLQFLSHKVFRLLVPYALVGVLLTSLTQEGFSYRAFAVLQLMGYGLALIGTTVRAVREQRLISVISIFVELNVAAVLALIQFARGRASARWEKT